MTLKVETSSGLKQISRLRAVITGGDRRVLRLSRVKADLSLETFFNDVPTLAATALPASFRATNNTTVEGVAGFAVTGGILPFTYLTTVISSSLPTAVLNEATASPTLRQTGVAIDTTGTANMSTLITDNSGQTATVAFTATFRNVGIS